MLIAVLALIGVPLWLLAVALWVLLAQNRSIRNRPGNIPNRFRASKEKRWRRGNSLWVHDVFAWIGSPLPIKQCLVGVARTESRSPTQDELKSLKRLGPDLAIVCLIDDHGASHELAVASEHYQVALGPFSSQARPFSTT